MVGQITKAGGTNARTGTQLKYALFHLAVKTEWDETILILLLEFFSPEKADLLPTDGGSSARSDPPGYGPEVTQ